jgi:hypothetical protein
MAKPWRIRMPLSSLAVLALLATDPAGASVSWTILPDRQGTSFRIEARDGDRNNMTRVGPIAEVPEAAALPFRGDTPRNVRFRIAREAGTLDCDGIAGGGHGSGSCRFQLSAEYGSKLAARGVGQPNLTQGIRMALSDVRIGFVDAMAEAGLREHSPDQLIRLKNHNVQPEFVRAISRSGLASGSSDVIRLRNHGVSAGFIREMRDAGVPDLTAQAAIRLRREGASGDFVRRASADAGRTLSAEELIYLRRRGHLPGARPRVVTRS